MWEDPVSNREEDAATIRASSWPVVKYPTAGIFFSVLPYISSNALCVEGTVAVADATEEGEGAREVETMHPDDECRETFSRRMS